METEENLLSIGALSKATGVPTETIRTWERRYGFPIAERTDSGHRRYSLGTLERLRLVTQVLALGYRPSNVLGAEEATLKQILERASGRRRPSVRPASAEDTDAALEPWFEHVERFESRAFERQMRSAWSELGAANFIELRVAPFLTELGERWARGELEVRHEHFASERLREFLSSQWRPLSDAATGPAYVLATMPNERHVLGLHLAALAVATAGGRVIFLGADSPTSDVAGAVEFHAADAVILSSASGSDPARLKADLASLREQLPPEVALVVGGKGSVVELPDGVARLETFRELSRWLVERGAS
jgi:DNA-binding transcriptional MerR regulator/methylmalonyl-CoA mutase cobalamin-binding subunit